MDMLHTTIALTRYKESNKLVGQALESLALQENIRADVLFMDQFENLEFRWFCENLSTGNLTFHYHRIDPICVSYARNYAIRRCNTETILFIDADAIADSCWAFYLTRTLMEGGAAVAGGKIVPKWHKKPSVLANANIVKDQYSLLDLGDLTCAVGKLVCASMGINIVRLGPEAYFNENLGRRDGNLAGGAEIDVCERALRRNLEVMYNGKAVVTHQILEERLTYAWLYKRFYWGGRSKAQKVGKLIRTPTNPKNSWDYIAIPVFLLPYLYGYFSYKFLNKKR